MANFRVKLVTVICEADLEKMLVGEMLKAGARGHTVTEARGGGRRGVRDALWGATSNVRIEVLCTEAVAAKILDTIESRYFHDYGIVMFMSDVEVRRADKF
ncbi:MAG: transcriptional regulator [Betaproteobacteria bacterium]|nr:transcriptional regulator [Betaproteobacteria bacterium]